LLGQVGLNSLQIQQLWAEFESQRKFLVQLSVVALQLLGVLSFQLAEGLSVLLLSLEKIVVPLLVELVILLDVSLLALFPLLGLVE
jgi:hypothetical protein